VNRALYAKKSVSGGQIFRSFSRQIIMDEASHISFPIFFFGDNFFHVGGIFS